jgi:hypothetical protein
MKGVFQISIMMLDKLSVRWEETYANWVKNFGIFGAIEQISNRSNPGGDRWTSVKTAERVTLGA